MGDPTLRMDVVAPPSGITATTNSGAVTLNWGASGDSVLGYHVYSAGANGSFARLTATPITATTYRDSSGSSGANYMVRAVKLETSSSGTYYNPSIGAFLNQNATGVSTNNGTGGGGSSTNAPGSTNSTIWVDDALPADTNTTKIGTNTVYVTNAVAWVDDAVPAGAVAGADGGDSWNWVSSNPAPVSGATASQSSIAAGLHQHYFSFATQTLAVN